MFEIAGEVVTVTCQPSPSGAGVIAPDLPICSRLIISRDDARLAGLTRYFTGEPCIHGHVDERHVSNTGCLPCARLLRAQYRAENFELISATKKAWRIKNSERIKSVSLAYRNANAAKMKAQYRKRYEANKADFIAKAASWYKADLMRGRAAANRRRAKIFNAGGKYSPAQIKELLQKQKLRCANSACRVSIKNGFHADHIMPLSRGGSNAIRNIQLLCAPCNLAKQAKHPIDWAQSLGLLV